MIEPGDRCRIPSRGNALVYRVMAVAEGYAMLRYPRSMPFVEPVKNLLKDRS